MQDLNTTVTIKNHLIMKNTLLIAIFCFAYTANAQYYSVSTSVNPVTFCNSSTSTSVNINIKCEGPCNAIVEYYSDRYGRWSYQSTKSSDDYGNISYIGTGLKLNKSHTYRVYVYRNGTSVNRSKLNYSDYKNVEIYTRKICN